MNLYFSRDQPAELTAILAKAVARMQERPDLAIVKPGRKTLMIDACDGYKPSMVGGAAHVRLSFYDSGWIYDMDEVRPDRGVSGGWCGDSIPTGQIRSFFEAWLKQTDPHAAEQFSLFA